MKDSIYKEDPPLGGGGCDSGDGRVEEEHTAERWGTLCMKSNPDPSDRGTRRVMPVGVRKTLPWAAVGATLAVCICKTDNRMRRKT